MTTSYHWAVHLSTPLTLPTFTFTFFIGPPSKYTFSVSPRPLGPTPLKRRRPLWDVDGSPHPTKKKRRLRLDLVTSRLSRPYSAPASNIADRGVARVGTWPPPRRAERNELRKAAIMNRLRHRLRVMKAAQAKPVAPVHDRRTHSQLVSAHALRDVVAPMVRTHELPTHLPPSPLGLSNYDALDLEDEILDGVEEDDVYYSDFSVRRSPRSDCEDYDYLDELDGIPPLSLSEEPLPMPQMKADVIMEECVPAPTESGVASEPVVPERRVESIRRMDKEPGRRMDEYVASAAHAGTFVMA